MNYSKFGKTELEVSRFGMGCMRLPQLPDKSGIDETEAIRMIRYAVDNGVNYFDTAYVYTGSEELLGKAMKDGYREKAVIVTKMFDTQYDTPEKCLDEQLSRLQMDEIDIYLFHGLGMRNWQRVKDLDLISFMEKMKQKGKIRHFGFSFHGGIDLFREIVDAYDWAMCMIEINYLDEHYPVGVEGLRYAAGKGLPVTVMEPLKGGLLTKHVPDDVRTVFDKSSVDWTPAEWGLRWVADFPEVAVVLSGVSTMEQLKENIKIFDQITTGCLSSDQKETLRHAQKLYHSKIKVRCTSCGYCLPCPANVEIPAIFRFRNRVSFGDSVERMGYVYRQFFVEKGMGADQCTECGKCEKVCPQHLSIIEKLKEAHAVLCQEK